MEFPVFQFVFSLGTTGKSLVLFSLFLPQQVFTLTEKIPPSLLFFRLNYLSSILAWDVLVPFPGPAPACPCVSCTEKLWPGHSPPGVVSLTRPAGNAFLMQPKRLLTTFATSAGSWSAWCPAGHPGPSLPSCFPAGCAPGFTGAWGYSSLAFPSGGLHEVPLDPFLQPFQVSLKGSTTICAAPPSSVSSGTLLSL